jgi:UDP-N-acetylglucosamine--N-acetylmuramyl-(pentapeptide) pyrophosphoryl-undecaprenol N-acetylglucosamine transferase
VSTLLVCSVGGHLAELHALLPGMAGLEEERLWVTFDTPQSRSLLAGEPTLFVEHSGPRDLATVLRNTARARALLRGTHPFTDAISTGSGIALSFLPLARARGVRCHYVESFTRGDGPSLTGKLLSRLPGISLYTQHPSWAQGRWRHGGSVLDAFEAAGDTKAAASQEPRRVVVTLGTMRDYAFPRLVERIHPLLPEGAEVLWQLGCTETPALPIESRRSLPAHELREAIAGADLIVAHAGCGSALAAMEAGKTPLLVPRRAARGENVDDHQVELAAELRRRGLAVVREVEELDRAALLEAAAGRVLRRPAPPPFRLAV